MKPLSNKQIKQHQTNIKSATGAFGISLVMTLVYLGKALLGRNFHFWFSNFVPEVLLKSAAFTTSFDGDFSAVFLEHWRGRLSLTWFCVLFAAYAIVCVVLLLLAGKHPPLLWAIFALQLCDTVCLVVGRLYGIPNAVEETMFIDVIFHVLVLLFLLVGGISAMVLPKDLRGDPRENETEQIIKTGE